MHAGAARLACENTPIGIRASTHGRALLGFSYSMVNVSRLDACDFRLRAFWHHRASLAIKATIVGSDRHSRLDDPEGTGQTPRRELDVTPLVLSDRSLHCSTVMPNVRHVTAGLGVACGAAEIPARVFFARHFVLPASPHNVSSYLSSLGQDVLGM
jgi:hypothetical protein